MGKYRFKTKKEFIRDGLWDDKYNCPDEWSYNGEMNKYLGTNVPEEFNTDCDKNTGFEYNDWVFSEDDYVLKEQQEYFDDLSQHIGRYIRALVDNPHLGSEVKKGDIGKIINKWQVDFPNRKGYSCTFALDKNNLGVKYELLPEDYSPEQEIKEPSLEFIPGKWYHFTTMKGKYNLYVKVASVTDRNLFFMNRESISNGYLGEAECIGIKLIENPRLVEDLSEIQKYLPDGHPDKVKNFKPDVGKWYSFNWDYSGKDHIVIAKIKKVEEDYFAVSWRSYLWLNKSYSDNDAYRFKDISNIKELSIKEIQPYLPNEHPDKITSNKFKKGEYIVLIGDGQSMTDSSTVQTDAYIQNHCYKVREADTFLMTELDSNGITTNGWQCIPYNPTEFHKNRNWRYATQEEIDEYERRGKPYDVTELNKQSFPEEGHTVVTDNPENLINYLEYHNRKCTHKSGKYNKNTTILAWNKSSYWFCEVGSSKMQYNKHFIEEIIGQPIYSDSQLSMKEIQEEVIKYSEETNATILLASDIKSKELHSTYENTPLSVKLLSNKTTHLINNVRVISSVNLKIK